MIKKTLLILLLLSSSLYAQMDTRLNDYPNGKVLYQKAPIDIDSAFELGLLYDDKIKDYKEAATWYEKAYELGSIDAAFNMGVMYEDLKEYEKSITWYKKAIDKGDKGAALNLGLLYKKLHQYNDAVFYYKKAHDMGNIKGAYSLGYLYDVTNHDFPNAIIWYKKAAEKGHSTAIKNLAYVYRDMKEDVMSSAYLMALIPNDYSKEKIFNRLNNIWKIDRKSLKKAYKLQLTLDIPKHYTGGID